MCVCVCVWNLNQAEGLCLLHPSHKGLLHSGSFPMPVECWVCASSFLGEEVRTPQNSWGHCGRLCAVRYLSTSEQYELPLIWEQVHSIGYFCGYANSHHFMTLYENVRNDQSSPLLIINERSSPNNPLYVSFCATISHLSHTQVISLAVQQELFHRKSELFDIFAHDPIRW